MIKKEDDECTLLNSRVTTCIRFLYQFNSDSNRRRSQRQSQEEVQVIAYSLLGLI